MEARMFVGTLAVIAAFTSLFALSMLMAIVFRRRRAAMAAQGERLMLLGLVSWRLRNGFAPLTPVVQFLLRRERIRVFADELVLVCARRNCMTAQEPVLSVFLAAVIMLATVIGLVLRNAFSVIACVLCLVVVSSMIAANERDKRNEEAREEVPHALESMSACFGAGFTLLQTFTEVAREVPGSLGDMFARCAHVLETGGSAEEALLELRTGVCASELAFVAVALDVQHQSGGTLRQVLQAATEAVKDSLELRRSLRVQTAQAKLSARIVVAIPFALVAIFSLISPDFLDPFFSSAHGYALFGLAIFMQVAGVVMVRRALAVGGVA